MTWFSLFKQKKEVVTLQGTPEHPENVRLHITARKQVQIKLTYLGSSWGEWQEKNRGLLLFNIELIQQQPAILEGTQITFSFDCHPTDECHLTWDETNNGCRNPDDKHRGVVKGSLPDTIRGQAINRHITHHRQVQLAPSIESPVGTFTLGSCEQGEEWTQDQQRCWIFNSHVLPPTGYSDFPKHTNVRFHWKHNKFDREDFPNSIRVGVIVDCLMNQDYPLSMTLSIDGSLGGLIPYFSRIENYEVLIPTKNSVRDRDEFIKQQMVAIFNQGHVTEGRKRRRILST